MKKLLVLVLSLVTVLSLTAAAWGAEDPCVSNPCNHVAAIGTAHYDTIQGAVDAAVSGDIITVIADHDMDCVVTADGLIYIADKSITIDLNGKTVTANYAGTAEVDVIHIRDGAHLTMMDSSAEKTGMIDVTAANHTIECFFKNTSGTKEVPGLIINSGSYKLDKSNTDGSDSLVYGSNDEATVVNGGTFHLGNVGVDVNGSPWIFNASGKNDARIIVNGGSFNDNIANQHWLFEVYINPEKTLVQDGNMWTLQDSVAYVTEHLFAHNWDVYITSFANHGDAFNTARENATDDLISMTLNKDWPVSDTLMIDFDFYNRDVVSVAPAIGETGLVMNGKTILWSGDTDEPIFTVKAGKKLVVNGAFELKREDCDFLGWYTDAAYENAYPSFGSGEKSIVDNTNSTSDITLYAKWKAKPSSTPHYPIYIPTVEDTTDKAVDSAKTFDAGIALYVGVSVMGAVGTVVLGKKRED